MTPPTDPIPPSEDDATFEPVTAWHPMLVAVLEKFLPTGWKLLPELLLRRLPQRVDIVLLRQEGIAPGPARKLLSVFDYLRPHTLIEQKGPTDDLAAEDALVLLGYAAQYMVLTHLRDPGLLELMVIADSIPAAFVDQIERLGGRFEPLQGGLWHGQLAGFELHGVATRDAFKSAPSERLFFAFSRGYLQAPGHLIPVLDKEDQRVYVSLYEQVAQFRKRRGPMALKDEELAEIAHERWLAELFSRLPLEQRLAGIPPEQVLKAYAPEERVADLTPEERLLLLPAAALAALSDDYLRSLSPETQAAIRLRISRPS